jgi:hypothetical protein
MRALLIVAALGLCACHRSASNDPQSGGEQKPFGELSVDQVDEQLASASKPFVFDANPKEVYDARHVPSAKWVPYDGIVASMLPSDKNATLIFYCANTH